MAPVSSQIVTVGYEGRTAEELVDELSRLGVRVLVDVRLTPLSRKPGLSKRRLASAVESAGITYMHLPELGNPKDNRDAFRAGKPAARSRFRARLRTPAGADAVRRVAELAGEARVALMCFERDHSTCHRQLVSHEVQRVDPDLSVVHTVW
jgi:uncharacterized protein (DUF488 family)